MPKVTILNHADGSVRIEELQNGKRHLAVQLVDPSVHMEYSSWETSYPIDLIAEILRIRGPARVCDAIMRDEDPRYVRRSIEYEVFGYVTKDELNGKRVLDFGCGGGASSFVLSDLLPESEIVGVELDEQILSLAQRRLAFYKKNEISFRLSPRSDSIPSDLGKFDAIIMSAVYEHLLPTERVTLLPKIWALLNPGGILFIFQTPFRWFPLESHTTRLPLINYLPDTLSEFVVKKFSNRIHGDETWSELLRKGIRGATVREIMQKVDNLEGNPVLLEPRYMGLKNRIDLWVSLSGSARTPKLKKVISIPLRLLKKITGIEFIPYISLAIKKT